MGSCPWALARWGAQQPTPRRVWAWEEQGAVLAPFEDVECADLVVYTDTESPERITMQIVAKLKQKGWL